MFPAQALAEYLKDKGWDIAMMTDNRGRKHSSRIPADPIIEVQAATISPRKPIAAISGVFKLLKGVSQAKRFIKNWQPEVVVGFGGYPAFPAMRAAQSLGIPTVIHEQNAVLGRVNRVFAKRAKFVASGFDNLSRLPLGSQHRPIGNPLRAQIIEAIPNDYTAPDATVNLLIVGGSLGAKLISEVMPEAIKALPGELRSRLNVVQQTREEYLVQARSIYEEVGIPHLCKAFFSDIETHLSNAHYVVGRAGASSVSEFAVMGKPSLLVPLAIAMDDHQTENAKALKSLGAADILPESDFTPDGVRSVLEDRLNDANWLEAAARSARSAATTNATESMAKLVIAAIQDA